MLNAARVHGSPMIVIAMKIAAITQPAAIQAAEKDPQKVEQKGEGGHGIPSRLGDDGPFLGALMKIRHGSEMDTEVHVRQLSVPPAQPHRREVFDCHEFAEKPWRGAS